MKPLAYFLLVMHLVLIGMVVIPLNGLALPLAFAQSGNNYNEILGNGIRNPVEYNSTLGFIFTLMRNFLLIIAGVAVAMVLTAGWMILISQGNEARLAKGKQALLWAILGFVVVILAYSVVGLVKNIFVTS